MNQSVLGIDLATRRYCDIGIAMLQEVNGEINCQFLKASEPSTNDPPEVERLADYVCKIAVTNSVRVIAIDGPQAWKAADNGLGHQRVSEKALRTQAKTGLPESCKPASSLRFVRFAINFYAALEARGWHRQMRAEAVPAHCAIEVFPTAAWRALGLKALPAKSVSSSETVANWLAQLLLHFQVQLKFTPSHDELQALMAGLVGLAILRGEGYRSFGDPPFLLDGYWREGFIVNFD